MKDLRAGAAVVNGAPVGSAPDSGRRRHRSRKVRLHSRRDYPSNHRRHGQVRRSRRHRFKRFAFYFLSVALAGVLSYAVWRARRPGASPTPPRTPEPLEEMVR